ncbi:MAG: hypothetical protein F6K41_11725 [Symploca sp. SIO3E6]|nr:hypothetical protein [Caldora sp. SIO3E6]
MYRNQLHPYLDSICQEYAQWWEFYTLTDVVGKQRDKQKQCPPLLDLMVQTVEQQQEEREEGKEKIERLGVVDGLRKYAPNHVLLVGRPGSGKSTALVRLLLEEAEGGRDAGTRGRGDAEMGREGERDVSRIPVLVELRYYQHSVLERVKAFLLKHQPNLDVDKEILKQWLHRGRLLLLLDGFNELPSEEARQQVRVFRQDYPNTPMVFTTRDLGVGGDLNITKKLEMQPLTEAQMRRFVCAYLPQQGKQMLKQLGNRLREFGETPLLLWMLCSVFANNSHQIPANLGSVFRRFTEIYDYQLKQGVCTYRESRDWWQDLLQNLAWVMTQGKSKTELMVAIPRQEAKVKLTEFLRGKVAFPDDDALRWLQDLLDYHLIQVDPGTNQIGFCHQLLLEYYTAESLLQRLTSLSDQQLKWDYLNYLKWTGPLALMMQLLEDQEQAVRLVKLALEVDWFLGAGLAGEVKSEFQEQTVGLVVGLQLPQLLKVELARVTKSDEAIPELINALEESNYDVHRRAAEALGEIGSYVAVTALINALENSYHWVRRSAAEVLGYIGSDTAVTALINLLEHSKSEVRCGAVDALGKTGSDAAVPVLINALKYSDYKVCRKAAKALGKIGSDAAVPALINALKYSDYKVCRKAAKALGKIGSDAAVPALINALKYSDYDMMRSRAAESLGKIGSDTAVPALINALEDSDYYVRGRAVEALEKIGSDAVVTTLINALENADSYVRCKAANSLGKIGSDAAVPALINALENADSYVRWITANSLGKIGSDAAVPALINALEDSEFYVRSRAAEALGEIGSDTAVPALINNVLEYSDYDLPNRAAEALRKIGSDTAIPAFINALEHPKSDVRSRAAEALGEIGSDAAVPALINALEYSDSDVRWKAADSLGKIGSDAAVPALIKALEYSDSDVCRSAALALGEIGSEMDSDAALIKALEHSDSDVCRSAAIALGEIGSEMDSDAVVPILINTLEDSGYYVLWRAAYSLGKIGSDTAIPQLINKLQDHNFATANRGDTLNQTLTTLNTIQERCQYYRPPPKLTMSKTLYHNYALLIGVGESAYPQWSLPVTVKDTLALKSLLTNPNLCGYVDDEQHLRLLNDAIATKESILSNLNWLQQQAAADSEATVLVYYSGHGWLDNDTGKYYLIPHDVEPFDIPNSALPADIFTEALRQIPAQRLLVIIDSCYAAGMATAKSNVGAFAQHGALAAKHLGDNSSTKPNINHPNALPSNAGKKHLKLPGNFLSTALPKYLIDKLKQGTGRAVFTSSTGEQKSWIRPDGNMSIYTFHFLEALQGAANQPGDQVVTVSNLMNYVGKTVPASAKQLCQAEQTPFFDFATEDFPVALLHGGKGLPQQGWDEVKEEAQERISQISNVSVEGNKSEITDIKSNAGIIIGTAGKINIGDISS